MRHGSAFSALVAALAFGLTALGAANGEPLGPGMSDNTDRAGSDYQSFTIGSPSECQVRCNGSRACKAWTYVRPGVQGPNALCYLKNVVPPPKPDTCCISGLKGSGQVRDHTREALAPGMSDNTDQAGSDIASFQLTTRTPSTCQAACNSRWDCKAWTYVRPGIQASNAVCYLKNAVPRATANTCCVSGKKDDTVRDHRTSGEPIVRDHRTGDSGPNVPDHRSGGSGPIVRDHRTGDSGPNVRDHRTGRSAPIVRPMPIPVLRFLGVEEIWSNDAYPRRVVSIRYSFGIINRARFDPALFVATPELPRCGRLVSSRALISIHDARYPHDEVMSFCSLRSIESLASLTDYGAPASTPLPFDVFVRVTDRLTGDVVESESISTDPNQTKR